MAKAPIPLIEVRGTHRAVGRQIGERMRPKIARILPRLRAHLPPGVSWDDALLQARLYLAYSRDAYPQFVDEVEGLAEGAGVPFEEVFLTFCEELWEPASYKGCTDLVARGPATATGATLVAHTNDLEPETEGDVVIFKVRAGEEPEFLGVSVAGLGYSAGFNAAGVSLTGNALSCSDLRAGVPRLLIVRRILAARNLGEAMEACLHPSRASSYNNVIADASGEAYSMEGSATACAPLYIHDHVMAHANHYVDPAMRRFEAQPNDIGGSIIRHNRALRLLRENYGRLTPELFQGLLADHVNYPASICKHGVTSVTVFSIIIDLDQLCAWIGPGRPCETTFHTYQLDPWRPPSGWPRSDGVRPER